MAVKLRLRMRTPFVTSQGSAFHALPPRLCLLLRDKAPESFRVRRWHGRFRREVSLEEAQAVLSALVLFTGERKRNAAYELADLLSRRGLERPCETLVAWARQV
jgi:hypothetical protein